MEMKKWGEIKDKYNSLAEAFANDFICCGHPLMQYKIDKESRPERPPIYWLSYSRGDSWRKQLLGESDEEATQNAMKLLQVLSRFLETRSKMNGA